MGTPNRRSRDMEILDRRRKVAELSVAGWTLRAIGEELGVSKDTVMRDRVALTPIWEREVQEDIGRFRGAMFAAYVDKRSTLDGAIDVAIETDDLKALAALVSAWRGIDDQLAKVIGAYAPEKVAGTVAVEMTEAEARKILDQVDV